MKPPLRPLQNKSRPGSPGAPSPAAGGGRAGGRLLRRQGGQSLPPDFTSLAGEGEVSHMAGAREGEERGKAKTFALQGEKIKINK